MNPPELQFKKFEIVKVLFDRTDQMSNDFKINITKTTRVSQENRNNFISEILVDIRENKTNTSLQVLGLGYFEMIGEVQSNVYENFTEISAPSIIYPYIRAFISNLMLQSGMLPVVLPPVNFAAVLEKQKKEQQELLKTQQQTLPK
jgi:preprotein translocase subunit SecB